MMSRSAIPPSRTKPKGSPAKTLQLLQKKLDTAETETMSLVRQLTGMGFQQHRQAPRGRTESLQDQPPVRPFLPSNVDSGVLHKNYEGLVSRVCRTESQIQTLKLNLCSLQAEKDLSGDEAAKLKERMMQQEESHAGEVKKLNHEVVIARKEWKDATEARNKAEEEARRLTSALHIATNTKSELAIEYEEFKTIKGKLNKRVVELREELAREVSLRTSLEDSHNTLLNRIQEMEAVVEAERKEVQTLSQDCCELRREGIRVQEDNKNTGTYQMQLEQTLHKLKAQLGDTEVKFTEVLEENKILGANLTGLRRENVHLHQQFEQMQNEHTKLQKMQTDSQTKDRRKSSEAGQGVIKAELQKLQDSNIKAEHKRQELEVELDDMRTSYNIQAGGYREQIQILENTVEELKTELISFRRDRKDVMKAKENLMDEVNQAVDCMSDERTKLQEQLQQAQLEMNAMIDAKRQLQQENNRLLERLAASEQQQIAQQKVESGMSEMLSSKNRLAYEKGQLQSRVAELQHKLTALATTRTDVQQLRKVNATLQAKYNQTSNELSGTKMVVQKLEGQLRQEQANSEMKEEDFRLAIQARDEALRETEALRNQVAHAQEKEQQKMLSLQQSLSDAKSDQGKITSTLDGVMGSHQHLQQAVERLQTELGRKDSELKSLRHERHNRQKTTNNLQREVEQLQAKLSAIETAESDQIHILQSELSILKDDKLKLSATLDDLIQTNSDLQTAVEKQRIELDKKGYEYQLLQQTRSEVTQLVQEVRDEYEKGLAKLGEQILNRKQAHNKKLQSEDTQLVQEVRDEYEERLGKLREQILNRKQAGNKKLQRELGDVKGQNEAMNQRLVQITQNNSELQQKLSKLEGTISKQTNRIKSQKTQLEHYHHIKQIGEESSSKMAIIQHQLVEMEKSNKDYVAKNKEQAKTITSFVSQMRQMELELKAVSQAQQDMSQNSRKKEVKVYKERGKSESLKEKISQLEQEACKMREERDRAEDKLLEISNESLQISSNLEEAHTWFKSRYDALQQELAKSKEKQSQLETINANQQHEIAAERHKSTGQAAKAKAMIKASREALSRVADKAEVEHIETKTHMRSMTYKLQAERDHSTMAHRKIHNILNSSAQYIEGLSTELEMSRTQDVSIT